MPLIFTLSTLIIHAIFTLSSLKPAKPVKKVEYPEKSTFSSTFQSQKAVKKTNRSEANNKAVPPGDHTPYEIAFVFSIPLLSDVH